MRRLLSLVINWRDSNSLIQLMFPSASTCLNRKARPLGGTLIVCGLLLLAACASQKELVVERFYRAVERGDSAEAGKLLDDGLLARLGSEQILRHSQAIRACAGIKTISVSLKDGNSTSSGGKVAVAFNGDCPPQTDNVYLIKDGLQWKLTIGKATKYAYVRDTGDTILGSRRPNDPRLWPTVRNHPELQEGDLIFQRGDDLVSKLILSMAANSRFSHVGIFITTGDEEYIIDSIPNRGVRAQVVADFLDESDQNIVFRPKGINSVAIAKIREYVHKQIGKPFDNDLKISDESAIYCTELIFNAFRYGDLPSLEKIQLIEVNVFTERILLPDSLSRWEGLEERSDFTIK
jgi:Permuted papain-like amidase enzyme, YaeF/YiiX, C92 family